MTAPAEEKPHEANVLLAVVATVVLLGIIGSLGSDDTSAACPRWAVSSGKRPRVPFTIVGPCRLGRCHGPFI
jgi:hypothetical protein